MPALPALSAIAPTSPSMRSSRITDTTRMISATFDDTLEKAASRSHTSEGRQATAIGISRASTMPHSNTVMVRSPPCWRG